MARYSRPMRLLHQTIEHWCGPKLRHLLRMCHRNQVSNTHLYLHMPFQDLDVLEAKPEAHQPSLERRLGGFPEPWRYDLRPSGGHLIKFSRMSSVL